MNNRNHLKPLLLAALIALPFSSLATSASDNCEVVKKAAVAGRDQTNTRNNQYEVALKQALERQRACLERFADLASRQSVVIGGFDASALRDFLGTQACNVIDAEVKSAMNDAGINQAYSRVQTAYKNVPSFNPVGQTTSQTGNSGSTGIFDRLSCWVGGGC